MLSQKLCEGYASSNRLPNSAAGQVKAGDLGCVQMTGPDIPAGWAHRALDNLITNAVKFIRIGRNARRGKQE